MARFKRSTLPEHKGTRTVVLRFLKIIAPLTCVIPNYDEHTGIATLFSLALEHHGVMDTPIVCPSAHHNTS